ncbi:Pectin lyase fold [Phytophthora cactorum]|nr:Pectin lyase fold [Phytophthora cactorum]
MFSAAFQETSAARKRSHSQICLALSTTLPQVFSTFSSMGRIQFALIAALILVAKSASAFTIGTPEGLAAGTTGGGNGTVVYPTTNEELITYLNSSEPLVVVLNKTFDFRGTEGTKTEPGCRPQYTRECIAKNNGFKSQDVILQSGGMANTGGCDNGQQDIRGIGKSGVIMGKGMTLNGHNIIVQNIHITELNHHLVWGGDAIYIQGTDKSTTAMKKIWLDHIKISRVGRQFITTYKASTDSMTISNSDFDGNTDYSASCDGHHYWSFIFYGVTKFSMLNNYIHGTSGALPRSVVTALLMSLPTSPTTAGATTPATRSRLARTLGCSRGNYFTNTRMPLYNKGDEGALYAASSEDQCNSLLGRSCVANELVSSGNFSSRNGETALETIKSYPTFVDYTSSSAQTSEQQQTAQSSDSVEQTEQQEYTPGTAMPSTEATQSSIQASDIENVWTETTDNFGVGKLD